VAALFSAYINGDVKKIAEGQQTLPPSLGFRPFEVGKISLWDSALFSSAVQGSMTEVQRNLVVLFSAAVIGLRKEVFFETFKIVMDSLRTGQVTSTGLVYLFKRFVGLESDEN